MKFTPAIQQCAELGWLLSFEDSQYDKSGNERPTCHVYAVKGNDKRRLCSMSELFLMNKTTFAEMLAGLPVEQESIA